MKLHEQEVVENKVLNFIKEYALIFAKWPREQGLYSCHMADIVFQFLVIIY
jgi:hypothetical protein